MKTKPLIIAGSVAVILIAAIIFILYGKNKSNANVDGIEAFIEKFTNYAVNGQTDSLLNSFAVESRNNDGVKRLVSVLAGKSTVNSNAAPLAKLVFNLDERVIETLSDGSISVTIPLFLSNTNTELEQRRSLFTLKLVRFDNGDYKITQADVRQFFTDFVAYENYVRSKTLKDVDIYSPETLEAFAAADKLKARFDSVIWFSHVNGKTYYYVVYGKWDLYTLNSDIDSPLPYKIGLVGPDMKTILPAEFDLIHHIGGTFPDMIEVEKGHKKGFYNISGKEMLPVKYDQIFPISGEGENIAALRMGDYMYWLKSDYTVSEPTDIKMADILPRLNKTGSFSMTNGGYQNLTEFNSREEHNSIYIPPSYMVDLNLLPVFKTFKNPLRRNVEYGDASENYIVTKDVIQNNIAVDGDSGGWLQTLFYNIRDYYLGGRTEFYDRKNIVLVDNKHNRVYTASLSTDYSPDGTQSLEGPCNVSSIRAITDSLFEVKVGSVLYVELYDTTKTVSGGPYYHYLAIKGNKLVNLTTKRIFSFTKFVKMDDSYLEGCYLLDTYDHAAKKNSSKRMDQLTDEMLRYIKNEIYADYSYKFSDKRWEQVFSYQDMYHYNENGEAQYAQSVTDSLTSIDKYNINFIDQKLKAKKATTLAAK
ncbi:YARHG domain-containing protein [Mucilaginibacter auburnensis]|uniref:YARHG domain-containing protein n=1 Tax=Mucilaginibacter auburnensis TaxID=1457233 RepID=A0A2H9VLC1_9SPHI|nr:YARHG domain-containing protein [Mucilaginibacter auburnensis]PJJ79112.1 YARHG domain-containing protein [Mucilaginibacter auburnensis]